MISVITVAYNDLSNLQLTTESVARLENRDQVEYIVVDGGSTDGTRAYLEAHDATFDHWISEPDKGIYDAMNKGTDRASGDWVIYMNAGDRFYRPDVLNRIDFAQHAGAAILYGSTYRRKRAIVTEPHPLSQIRSGAIMACHQSMFFNRRLLGERLRYRAHLDYSGDTDLVLRLYKAGEQLTQLPLVIADYDEDGITSGGGIPRRKLWRNRYEKARRLLLHFGPMGLVRGLLHKIKQG